MNRECDETISYFFVYGTLCKTQCRGHLWPRTPIFTAKAFTIGLLYGRKDYPALRPADSSESETSKVLGECWAFASNDVEAVTHRLDQIEGTNQPAPPGQPAPPNLYDRVWTTVTLLGPPGGTVQAQCYHYATDPIADGFHLIDPSEDGYASWPE